MINSAIYDLTGTMNDLNDLATDNYSPRPMRRTLSSVNAAVNSPDAATPIPSKMTGPAAINPCRNTVTAVNKNKGSIIAGAKEEIIAFPVSTKIIGRSTVSDNHIELESAARRTIANQAPNSLRDVEKCVRLRAKMGLPKHSMTMRTLAGLLKYYDLEDPQTDISHLLKEGNITDSHEIEVLEMLLLTRTGLARLKQGENVARICHNLGVTTQDGKVFINQYIILDLARPLLDEGNTCHEICQRYGLQESADQLALDSLAYERVESLLDAGKSCPEIYQILGFTRCFSSYDRIEKRAVEKKAKELIDLGLTQPEIERRLGITRDEARFLLEDKIDEKKRERRRLLPARSARSVLLDWYNQAVEYLHSRWQWFMLRRHG